MLRRGELLKAQETTLKAMLEGQKQYVVPLYQRRYAWSQPEWKPLWGAVLREYRELETGEDDRGHFLGSVVVQQMPAMAHGVQRYAVIDGQQRLTTAFILLAALRDISNDAHLQEQIQNLYLTNPYADAEHQPKLRLGAQDQPDIERLVAGHTDKAAGKIGAAYWWFRNEADLFQASGILDVARLVQAVTMRMEVVDIGADDRDNAYRIFQTLNSTGKQLTAVDLLRNHFFMLLPTRADEAYVEHWAPMESLLGHQIGAFLWVELVSRGHGKESVPTSGVYAAWQADLEAITGNEDAVFDALKVLHGRAELFDAMTNVARLAFVDQSGDLKSALSGLADWGSTVHQPITLQLLSRCQGGELSSDEAATACKWVESFLVRRMIARVPTNNLNRIFTTVAGQLAEETSDLANALRRVLSGPGKYWPTDSEVATGVLVEPFYLTQRGTQRQFILRKLEEDLASPYRPDWEACAFTIEHVMPQTLSPWWYQHLKDSGEDPVVAHEQLLHTIGNVTLTCENSELGNQSFDEKKPLLRADILRLNKKVVAKSQWTRKEIEARSRELGSAVIRIWPAPLQGLPAEPQWDLMIASLAQLPEGRWTSYDDLADLAATSPSEVRKRFVSMSNAAPRREAVLMADGRIDAKRPDVATNVANYRQLLVSQGVLDDINTSAAAAAQRFTPQDFAQLLGEE